jgi:hypothetical protein
MCLRGRVVPQSSETSRLPHFVGNRLADDGEFVSLRQRRRLLPGRFLLLMSVTG